MADEPACEFPSVNASPAEIDRILAAARTIAVVGLSPRPERPSHDVAAYLMAHGFRIIPVNPGHEEILGEKCYRSLAEVTEPVDIVDVFRRPEAVPEIVDAAIAMRARVIWMQLGIVNNAAAERARAAGLAVVMNRCLKVEHMAWRARGAAR